MSTNHLLDYEPAGPSPSSGGRFWSIRMGPPYRVAAITICATILLLVIAVKWSRRPVSTFPPGFNQRAFHVLAPGTPVEQVIRQVGPPFAFNVDGPQLRNFQFVSVPHLLEHCHAADAQLIYSWRGKSGRAWEVYVVYLKNGKAYATAIHPAGGG